MVGMIYLKGEVLGALLVCEVVIEKYGGINSPRKTEFPGP